MQSQSATGFVLCEIRLGFIRRLIEMQQTAPLYLHPCSVQAVQLESVSSVRIRYLIIVSTLANKDETILLGMDFPKQDRCVRPTVRES